MEAKAEPEDEVDQEAIRGEIIECWTGLTYVDRLGFW
jgi:hypothetical protein